MRVKRAMIRSKRKKKLFARAKGFYGGRKNLIRSAQEAVRHGLRAVWNRLPGRSAPAEPETPEEARSLKSAPMTVMDMAAPAPEWDRMGGAGLEQALGGWLEGGGSDSQAIVGGPASGVRGADGPTNGLYAG